MSNTYKGKNEKKSAVRKVLGIIAAVLAILIVAGVLISYNLATSGFVQRSTTAMESENYKLSGASMTYLFNTTYQNYVNQLGDYVSMFGLDTSKDLKSQTTAYGDGTWYDYFLSQAKMSGEQLLVLCEAAKADGFEVEGLKDEVDEAIDTMKSYAAMYNVTFDYYIRVVYGNTVNEKVLRQCLEMSEIASHYSSHMMEQYSFTEADWDKYYEDNKESFLKLDWMTYTFTAEAETLGDEATEEEKTAAETRRTEEYENLKVFAAELTATDSADAFKAYVENYLTNVKYAGIDAETLAEDKIDISEIVAGLEQTGKTTTADSDSELNKWAFDDARAAYDTYSETNDTSFSVSVYMLLPNDGAEDLGYACKYRDSYSLKDFRYIPLLSSEFDDSMDAAKAAADKAFEEYNENATEDNFAELASDKKYGDGLYEGGLRENADKGAISDEVDEWLYSADRKKGDCEIFEVKDKGYYIVYYVGDGDVKWQLNADSSLKNNKYNEDYNAFAEKYSVTTSSKGMKMIDVISLNSSNSSSSK